MMMDNDYALFFEGPPPPPGPAARRAKALAQWMAVRADAECAEAIRVMRAAQHAHRPAWRLLRDRNQRRLPRSIALEPGERAASPPPSTRHAPLAAPVAEEAANIAAVDPDDILAELQPADPLSWHCPTRATQRTWFCRQPSHPRADLPRPRVHTDGALSLGERWSDDVSLARWAPPASDGPVLVRFDAVDGDCRTSRAVSVSDRRPHSESPPPPPYSPPRARPPVPYSEETPPPKRPRLASVLNDDHRDDGRPQLHWVAINRPRRRRARDGRGAR